MFKDNKLTLVTPVARGHLGPDGTVSPEVLEEMQALALGHALELAAEEGLRLAVPDKPGVRVGLDGWRASHGHIYLVFTWTTMSALAVAA